MSCDCGTTLRYPVPICGWVLWYQPCILLIGYILKYNHDELDRCGEEGSLSRHHIGLCRLIRVMLCVSVVLCVSDVPSVWAKAPTSRPTSRPALTKQATSQPAKAQAPVARARKAPQAPVAAQPVQRPAAPVVKPAPVAKPALRVVAPKPKAIVTPGLRLVPKRPVLRLAPNVASRLTPKVAARPTPRTTSTPKAAARPTPKAAKPARRFVRRGFQRRNPRWYRRFRRRLRSRGYRRRPMAKVDLKREAMYKDCRTYLRRTGQKYCIELSTMGQGDWLFTVFGHNALRVVARGRVLPSFYRRDLFFNFGTFGGGKPVELLVNYLQFRLRYFLSLATYSLSIRTYRYFDRDFWVRRLILTPQEAEKIVKFLRWHYKPKNRYYNYHHYTNNCSTKIRDALAKALGKRFKKRAMVKRGATYRKHVMKNMSYNPLIMVLMDFGMGPPADRELTWWEEMFLPNHLEEFVLDPMWIKLRGAPLAGPKRMLVKRKGKSPSQINPVWIIWAITLLWLLLSALLFRTRAYRWVVRIALFAIALLGAGLLFMLVGTRFPEPPGNVNILFYHPFHLIVWWWLGRKRWQARSQERDDIVRWYLTAHFAAALVYLLLKVVGLVPHQVNTHYIFLAAFVFGIPAARLWIAGEFGPPLDETSTEEPDAAEAEPSTDKADDPVEAKAPGDEVSDDEEDASSDAKAAGEGDVSEEKEASGEADESPKASKRTKD